LIAECINIEAFKDAEILWRILLFPGWAPAFESHSHVELFIIDFKNPKFDAYIGKNT